MLLSKVALIYAVIKGVSLGFIAFVIIGNTDLSPLMRSLIVAGVSGILGIVGIVTGAYISAHTMREISRENQEYLVALKQSQEHTQGRVDEVADHMERRTDTDNVGDTGNRERATD